MKTNKRKINTISNPTGIKNKSKAENLIKILVIVGILGTILISGCVDEKPDSDNKEWAEISIFCQCCKEPWGNDNNIKPFFEEKGIKIYDIKITKRVVCEACNCPSYEKKEVLIDSKDKGKLLEILSNYPNETSEECKLTDEEAISISNNTTGCKETKNFRPLIYCSNIYAKIPTLKIVQNLLFIYCHNSKGSFLAILLQPDECC